MSQGKPSHSFNEKGHPAKLQAATLPDGLFRCVRSWSVAWVLFHVAVQLPHLFGNGEDGGVAFVVGFCRRVYVVEFAIAPESYEVLSAPSLPYEFAQPLVENVVERSLYLWHWS